MQRVTSIQVTLVCALGVLWVVLAGCAANRCGVHASNHSCDIPCCAASNERGLAKVGEPSAGSTSETADEDRPSLENLPIDDSGVTGESGGIEAPQTAPRDRQAGPDESTSESARKRGLEVKPRGTPSAAARDFAVLAELAGRAEAAYAAMENYTCVLTREESIHGRRSGRETLRLSFRKRPWSIHLTWISEPNRGRELVYVPGRFDDKIHGREPTFLGKIRLRMDPHGELARRNSRHPITEAGIGSIIERYRQAVEELRGGKLIGQLRYLGLASPGEARPAMHRVQHILDDASRRDIYFDAQTSLPVVTVLVGPDGELLEFYRFDDIQPNRSDLQSPTAFDPSRVLS